MHHVALSPHPDDVALSIGDLMSAARSRHESVTVITVFDGLPGERLPPAAARFHSWIGETNLPVVRQLEDAQASAGLGVERVSLGLLDALYRWSSDEHPRCDFLNDVFGAIHADDVGIALRLQERLKEVVRALGSNAHLYIPLAVGGHIDHVITRLAAEALLLTDHHEFSYYEDIPYALNSAQRERVLPSDRGDVSIEITESDLLGWLESVSRYSTQLRMLFGDSDWRNALRMTLSSGALGYEKRIWSPQAVAKVDRSELPSLAELSQTHAFPETTGGPEPGLTSY